MSDAKASTTHAGRPPIVDAVGDDIEVVQQCILCSNREARSDPRFRRLLALVPPYDVKRCGRCGLRWLSPRPSETGYERLYAYENYFAGDLVPGTYEEVAKGRAQYFRDRLKKVSVLLDDRRALTILDVGAATGTFVHQALLLGHQATGTELSQGARDVARREYGIELLATRIDDVPGAERYDVVHANHVLEHVPAPDEALNACRRLLKRDGLLILEVPQQIDNDVERLKRLLGLKRPRFDLYSLHHTYFFRCDTLRALLERCGFVVKRLSTANPSATPLWPISARTWFLRFYLFAVDRLHRGGNIVEVFAARTR